MAKKKKKKAAGKKKPLRMKKVLQLSPSRCFKFGHELMRVQCGIAFALNELKGTGTNKPGTADPEKLRVAMATVNKFALAAAKMVPAARDQAKALAKDATNVARGLKRGVLVSGVAAANVSSRVQGLISLSSMIEEKGKASCER